MGGSLAIVIPTPQLDLLVKKMIRAALILGIAIALSCMPLSILFLLLL